MKALIFDCDGVLAETERGGHLPAFNAALAEFALPFRWSENHYGRLLKIGGGKERLRLDLQNHRSKPGIPQQDDDLDALVARLHRRKSEIFQDLVAAGQLEPLRGVRRLAQEALDAGWQLGVASTSAEHSVRAVMQVALGAHVADQIKVVAAGDVVPRKKPSPDVYLWCLAQLGVDPQKAVVIEDSAIGLAAARAAGIACLVVPSHYTRHEDMTGAARVVASLGEPGDRDGQVTLDDLEELLATTSVAVPPPPLTAREALTVVAETAIAQEEFFSELDAVVGDGDFGHSLARGFEGVAESLRQLDSSADPAALLRAATLAMMSKAGGTSGPIWGTGFLRASVVAQDQRDEPVPVQLVAMLRAAAAGISERGKASLGDKTLLDALVPATDALDSAFGSGQAVPAAVRAAADVARQSAEATALMKARRGRASYTGDRSIGSPDAGAVAVSVLIAALAARLEGSTP